MQFRRAAAIVLCALSFSSAGAAKPALATKAAAKPTEATKPAAKPAALTIAATKPAAAAKGTVMPPKAAAKPKSTQDSREKAAQNALPQLQAIMARAQTSLARAEQHHEKTVKKVRAQVDALFQQQAKVAGALVAKYAFELDEAARELSAVINASKAELAAEQATEANSTNAGWGGAPMEERARAGAKADAALGELHHIMRKRDGDVEEATRHALEPLEYAAQELSRKVGDLSQVSDSARASLESAAKEAVGAAPLDVKFNVTKDAKAVEKEIEAARNATAQKLKAADKELAEGLASSLNVTNAGVNALERTLTDAEKEEIKRVRR